MSSGMGAGAEDKQCMEKGAMYEKIEMFRNNEIIDSW